MKTSIVTLFLIITSSIRASTIQLDLGPPTFHHPSQIAVPFSLVPMQVNGQTFDLNISFAPNQFISIFQDPQHLIGYSFLIALGLNVQGTDQLLFLPSGSTAFTTDQNGQNSATFIASAGTTAFCFPLLADANGTPRQGLTSPFSIFGFNAQIPLPNDPNFTLSGGTLFIGEPGAASFSVGLTTPDNGSTFLLLASSLIALAALSISSQMVASPTSFWRALLQRKS